MNAQCLLSVHLLVDIVQCLYAIFMYELIEIVQITIVFVHLFLRNVYNTMVTRETWE